MSLHETPPDPVADLAIIPDPQERLSWIIDRGRRLPVFPPAERVERHRVPGCVSPVWLIDESTSARCHFRGDAEAPVLRGMIWLICAATSGRRPADIAADASDVVARLDLARHLTPTRINGLRALQQQIRDRAAVHVAPAGEG